MKLNNACLKDPFQLRLTDSCADATLGFEWLLFLDMYSKHNKILMNPNDEEKTSFLTKCGTFCYRVMPFGLKNARTIYQRMVNKVFEWLIGTFMEAYIDDTVVKSTSLEEHLKHLRQVFEHL